MTSPFGYSDKKLYYYVSLIVHKYQESPLSFSSRDFLKQQTVHF